MIVAFGIVAAGRTAPADAIDQNGQHSGLKSVARLKSGRAVIRQEKHFALPPLAPRSAGCSTLQV